MNESNETDKSQLQEREKDSSISFDSQHYLVKEDKFHSDDESGVQRPQKKVEQSIVKRVENSNESQMDDFMIGDSEDQVEEESYYESMESEIEQKVPIQISLKNIQNMPLQKPLSVLTKLQNRSQSQGPSPSPSASPASPAKKNLKGLLQKNVQKVMEDETLKQKLEDERDKSSNDSFDEDPVIDIADEMEQFYHKNFTNREVLSFSNDFRKRIWNAHFDRNLDQIYIFIATIKELDDDGQAYKVEFKLDLELWDLDDRLLFDQNHSQKPAWSFTTFTKVFEYQQKMDNRYLLHQLYQKYKNFTQLFIMHSHVVFFNDLNNLSIYNVETKILDQRKIKLPFSLLDCLSFQISLHYKDVKDGKKQLLEFFTKETVEYLVFTIYNHVEVIGEQILNRLQTALQFSMIKQPTKNNESFEDSDDSIEEPKEQKKYRQTIEMKFIEFRKILAHGNQKANKQQVIKVGNESLQEFVDERVRIYYDNHDEKDPPAVQRIEDSSSYIIVFPTGLIMLMANAKLSLISQVQLNLRKDEIILDYYYCVSRDQKQHCFWFIDKKQQVWKCYSDKNPNECFWTLIKCSILDGLLFKKFFQNATTFDDFYMCTSVSNISCMREILKNQINQDYMIRFSNNSTKMIIIMQPECADKWLGLMGSIIGSNQNKGSIQIVAVTKINHIIMNFINKKKQSQFLFEEKKDGSLIFQSDGQQKQSLKEFKAFMNDNDILELSYMGKKLHQFNENKPKQEYRIFLVRRKRILQVMYTNGLSYWTDNIKDSEPKIGYFLSEMRVAKINDCIICYYQREDDNRQQYLRIFNSDGINFVLQGKEKFQFSEPKNIGFDKNGRMKQIQIKLTMQDHQQLKRQRSQIEHRGLYSDIQFISLEKSFIMKELLDADNKFDHLNLSKNGQLIMCGRLIIQLDLQCREVNDIGVIIMQRHYSKVSYSFMSLLQEKNRLTIKQLIKKNINTIVHFDREIPPVSPLDPEQQHLCFFTYSLEHIGQQQTSIIKINSKNMVVNQIYQSEFLIVHLSIKDLVKEDEMLKRHISKKITANITNTFQNLNKKKEAEEEPEKPIDQKKFLKVPIDINSSLSKAKNLVSYIKEAKWSNEYKKKDIQVQDGSLKKKASIRKKKLMVRSISQDFKSENDNFDDAPRCCISLVSQTKQSVNVEIILDQQMADDHENNENSARLIMLINVCTNQVLLTSSEVAWISNSKLILTLNNEFCLLNLFHKNWVNLNKGIQFCRQHVNMGVYVSILRTKQDKKKQRHYDYNLVQSCRCIQLMEIASLARYAFIRQAKHSIDYQKDLLFFTPCEELDGANILSKLSSKYDIIKPYLERIDSIFVALMNHNVKNMIKYLNKSFSIKDIQQNIEVKKIAYQGGLDKFHGDSKQIGYREIHFQTNDKIHMFQVDISGQNSVDKAFQNNSILSIKAFVESIISLNDDMNFRNCFDKALILMIQRGMDVKKLVASEVFFPQVFRKYNVYSRDLSINVVPFNGDIADLEFVNPQKLFHQCTSNNLVMSDANQQEHDHDDDEEDNDELFEVQFNFINMQDIEGKSKISISKALKDCQDIDLFSIESIRSIIDYKWQTSSKNYFRRQFYIYMVFMLTFFIECQTVNREYGQLRNKDYWFWIRKGLCFSVQLFFFGYEAIQFQMEGKDYWLEMWNYIEVAEFPIFFGGSLLDIRQEMTTDLVQIFYVLSVLISLSKFLKLIRCFRQLSFLVMMIEQVVMDVKFFFVLFGIFLLSFGECYHILDINVDAYGRMPEIAGQFIQTLRAAMGDLALIDPVHTFDNKFESGEHKNEYGTVIFIFCIFMLGQFFLFMIFMNFIIAVINESYGKIIIKKENYDYLQRIKMIFEREAHFKEKDFQNNIYFPKIIVVRKKKQEQKQNMQTDLDQQINSLKNVVKEQAMLNRDHYSLESKFQREHITNQIKYIENEIQRVQDDIGNVSKNLQQLAQVGKKYLMRSMSLKPTQQQQLEKKTLKKIKQKSLEERPILLETPDMAMSRNANEKEQSLSVDLSKLSRDRELPIVGTEGTNNKPKESEGYKELKEENRVIREQQSQILEMQKEILRKLNEKKVERKKPEGIPKLPMINFMNRQLLKSPIRRAIINSPMSQAEMYPSRPLLNNPMSLHQLSFASSQQRIQSPVSSGGRRSYSEVTGHDITNAIQRLRNKTQQK